MKKYTITKLGDQLGCVFDDIISIELSPADCEEIADIYRDLAMNSKDYRVQGEYREMCDFFTEAFEEWRRLRNENGKNEN